MQWLQPSFTEGSIIVQDKQQSPTSPNDVEKQGILAEIFTKMMIFSKKKKKYLILANIRLFLFHRPLVGHNIKEENPVCGLGFLQVWGSKHLQSPQNCLSQCSLP